MNYKNKLLLWSSFAVILGFVSGYIFSLKFYITSSPSLTNKEIELNQSLRKILFQDTFLNYELINAIFFNLPTQESIQNNIIKNNEELGSLFSKYYSQESTSKIIQLLNQNTEIIEQIIRGKFNLGEIENKKSEYAQRFSNLLAILNPEWAFDIEKIKSILNEKLTILLQISENFKSNNWQRSIELENKYSNLALQLSDKLEKGIIKQFSTKF